MRNHTLSVAEPPSLIEQKSMQTESTNSVDSETVSDSKSENLEEFSFELGLWLSGVESYLTLRASNFFKNGGSINDWSKEIRLIHSVLQRSSILAIELTHLLREEEINLQNEGEAGSLHAFSSEEVFEISQALKESIMLNEAILSNKSIGLNEWIAWSKALSYKLTRLDVFIKLVAKAEKIGEGYLPQIVVESLMKNRFPSRWDADLRVILPKFAKILKWLSVVGKMLEKDEPLKPTLVIFARINEQMREMMGYINNRLLRFSDEEDALFGSLDAAAYTASIELRKVYEQELKGITKIRPTPHIYAKIETSYSLLNDSLQLTLVNFVQLIDQGIESTEIFPTLRTKELQSVDLRENMWQLLQGVKEAEEAGVEFPLDSLHINLNKFHKEYLKYLFYKDMETVDRFIEEILITEKSELVPLLHRFGAYLETLLGQINMRAVLASHPFEPMQRDSSQMFE